MGAISIAAVGNSDIISEEAATRFFLRLWLFSSWLIFLDGKLHLVEFDFFLHPFIETV